jgi:hypothetical protein
MCPRRIVLGLAVMALVLAGLGMAIRANDDPHAGGTAPATDRADQTRVPPWLPGNRFLLLYAGVVLIVVLLPTGGRSSSQSASQDSLSEVMLWGAQQRDVRRAPPIASSERLTEREDGT